MATNCSTLSSLGLTRKTSSLSVWLQSSIFPKRGIWTAGRWSLSGSICQPKTLQASLNQWYAEHLLLARSMTLNSSKKCCTGKASHLRQKAVISAGTLLKCKTTPEINPMIFRDFPTALYRMPSGSRTFGPGVWGCYITTIGQDQETQWRNSLTWPCLFWTGV